MKKKGLMIGGICLAVVAGILGYNHEAVRVVFHKCVFTFCEAG